MDALPDMAEAERQFIEPAHASDRLHADRAVRDAEETATFQSAGAAGMCNVTRYPDLMAECVPSAIRMADVEFKWAEARLRADSMRSIQGVPADLYAYQGITSANASLQSLVATCAIGPGLRP